MQLKKVKLKLYSKPVNLARLLHLRHNQLSTERCSNSATHTTWHI